nr:MAG TPA: Terminase small subunit [Caudoviricetes sp.]
MNVRQQKFCDYYLQSGNATDAAIKAGYSEKTARAIGAENLTKLDIQKYLAEHEKKAHKERIATAEEILEFLSDTVRDGEVGRKDRLKAAELLGKRYALFEDRRDNGNEENGGKTVEFIFTDTSMKDE